MKDREYYESLDKRTKEYKEWKASMGLGDAVEKVTEATGIKTLVEHLYGEDCGCEDRKNKLNAFGQRIARLFRSDKPKTLTKGEYTQLKGVFQRIEDRRVREGVRTANISEQQIMLEIYNRIFSKKEDLCTTCKGWKPYEKLKSLIKEYDS